MDDQDRYTRITLRIPRDLHVKLAAEAEKLTRSMNAEIINRLELSFISDPTGMQEANDTLLKSIREFQSLWDRMQVPEYFQFLDELEAKKRKRAPPPG